MSETENPPTSIKSKNTEKLTPTQRERIARKVSQICGRNITAERVNEVWDGDFTESHPVEQLIFTAICEEIG